MRTPHDTEHHEDTHDHDDHDDRGGRGGRDPRPPRLLSRFARRSPARERWLATGRLPGPGWQAGPVPTDDEPGRPGARGPRGRGGRGPGHGHPHHGHAGGPPFGPGGWMGPRRGSRARRGDVRAAVLALLDEESRNGYQLITEIEQRSGGVWKPSPGSVYPVLAQLEDEGLVEPSREGGCKAFVLTDAGRDEVASRSGSAAPWDAARDDMAEGTFELMGGLKQVGGALWQIAGTGTAEQQRAAAEILADTRTRLYRLLAGDDGGDATSGPTTST